MDLNKQKKYYINIGRLLMLYKKKIQKDIYYIILI